MGPHKDPAKLPLDDQLKLLRNTVDEIASDVSFQGMRLRSVESQVKIVRTEIKDIGKEVKGLNKRFDKQEQLFEKWKNEILTAIDSSFTKPVNDLQIDHAAQQSRLEEHQEDIGKLKVKVFGATAA